MIDDRVALKRYAGRGDPEAFASLVERYRGMVHATCLRALGDAADADEATQEVFLRFAQGAARIRSSAAAWLHACAMGVSVDLIRRGAVRRRAEDAAGREGAGVRDSDGGSDAGVLWRDMEPVIDAALEALDERDRALIVSRYLAGRSQADLAREMGVSEGTVSRRLRKAMDRLRADLSRRGLAIGGGVVLAAAMERGVAAASSGGAHLGAGAMKVALTETVRSGSYAGFAGVGALAWVGAAVVGAGVVGGWFAGFAGGGALGWVGGGVVGAGVVGGGGLLLSSGMMNSGGSGLAGGAVVAQPVADDRDWEGVDSPRRRLGPFPILTATDSEFEDRGVWITRDAMSMRHGYTLEGVSKSAVIRIDSFERDTDGESVLISGRVRRIEPAGDPHGRFELGQAVEIRARFDALGRLVLSPETEGVQLGRNEPGWYGVRPPAGWEEYGRIPDDAGAFGLFGPWTESERAGAVIERREIRFGSEEWPLAIYRIVEWERLDGWSRVRSINGGGRDPRLIGTGFNLLIRREGTTYEIAYYPPSAGGEGAWPSGFEYSEANPVRVVRFEVAEDE